SSPCAGWENDLTPPGRSCRLRGRCIDVSVSSARRPTAWEWVAPCIAPYCRTSARRGGAGPSRAARASFQHVGGGLRVHMFVGRFPRSEAEFRRALKVIPEGTTQARTPSTLIVGAYPIFGQRGKGAYVWDVDGNRYIDWILSFGTIVLGHSHPVVN